MPALARELFQDALRAVWDGYNEIDGFNALVLGAGLTWRQATVLRAYAKYMRQGNSPVRPRLHRGRAAQATSTSPGCWCSCSRRGSTPARTVSRRRDEARIAKVEEVERRLVHALDDVASLDHDRILRSYLTHIKATLRTNYFQPAAGHGRVHAYISFKLEPSAIPDLPEPRPKYEIFVYSPRVEGVHLRFGSVARGGLRWSDRRDDFRTEVLGLVKAQMVKNTVIVPVGAKGGFFCKQLPDSERPRRVAGRGHRLLQDLHLRAARHHRQPRRRRDGSPRWAWSATTATTPTSWSRPTRAPRRSPTSPTASPSTTASGSATRSPSGGSVGYDHKAMGITARGAWVSVQRHFRERGIDCQTEDFTAVGIGDMSGDVFGNGMLCSEHTRLVAAFDHRDIFLDPTPDAATSYAERRRLFELPRSSWQDYDTSLISEGGGVFPRSLKSIPLNAAVREALGIDDDVRAMTPAELMKAILQAPVDLLWNGGIGTYVKAADETHADAGDKANDAIRVNGRDAARQVRRRGRQPRPHPARPDRVRHRASGRMNTDFIDNSAGVDTSDHEVNIKILLDRVVADGDLTREAAQRAARRDDRRGRRPGAA